MSDTPPARAPVYFSGGWFRMGSDEPQFRITGPFRFEFQGEESDDPALAARYYAAECANDFARETAWLVTGGWHVSPGAVTKTGRTSSVPFTARSEAGASVEGRLDLTPDPSDWVKVEAYLGSFRVFLGYFDRVWQEFDLWPSGASGEGDAPGRIGRKRNRVSLSDGGWPVVGRLGSGHLSIEATDL